MLKFNISEIFYSIQGEGSRAGRPCIFIRIVICIKRHFKYEQELSYIKQNFY